ncbi:MAG: hypothetical protein ACM3PY_01445, partial [Omnitrophica WOR_2 bacterium]
TKILIPNSRFINLIMPRGCEKIMKTLGICCVSFRNYCDKFNCEAKGLTGRPGAIIPESNACNLMLKERVVEAVKNGMFHILPVKSIDEGIEILTGVKAGERLQDNRFEENTVKWFVDKRLDELAERLATFGKKDEREDNH